MFTYWNFLCMQCYFFVCFICSILPLHWSPSISVDILAMGLLTCHPLPIIVWQFLGTHTHTAGYGIISGCLILKVSLAVYLYYLLKLTVHVKKKSVWLSVKVNFCLCLTAVSQVFVKQAYVLLTGVLDVSPVCTQKQSQRFHQSHYE